MVFAQIPSIIQPDLVLAIQCRVVPPSVSGIASRLAVFRREIYAWLPPDPYLRMVQGSNPRADSLSTVVIDAIANYRGVGPADLERPLYEFIDPDALDCLYQRWLETEMTRPASLTFQYRDLAVHVTSGGDVTVTEHGDAESDPVA